MKISNLAALQKASSGGRYLDIKGRKTNDGENCIMMNFIACILHRILLG
jgi:hypothetical protein